MATGKRTRWTLGSKRARRNGKVLLAVVLIGELLAIGVGGTFASYNGQTENAGNQVAAGSLVLQSTIGSSSCQSWTGSGVGNVNASCGTLLTAGPLMPGQSSTVNVALTNDGSLAAGDLSAYAPSNCSPSVATSPSVESVCDALQLVIEETSAPITLSGVTLSTTSKTATVSGALSTSVADVALNANSAIATTSAAGGFSAAGIVTGMSITGTGVQSGTTVSSVSGSSLTMSKSATAAESESLTFAVVAGMQLTGTGIAALTTVTAVGSGSLTLSQYPMAAESAESATVQEPENCFYPSPFVNSIYGPGWSGACSFELTSYSSDSQLSDIGSLIDFTYYEPSTDRLPMGALAAQQTRYFTLGFLLPSATSTSVGATYQDKTATFDLAWYLSQQAGTYDLEAP